MLFDDMKSRYNAWRSYRRTVNALNALDERELSDIGIGRWQINDIARRGSFR